MREKQIIKYFLEGLPPAEREELMSWLTAGEDNMRLFKSYEKVFDKTSQYRHPANAGQAFDRLPLVAESAGAATKTRIKKSTIARTAAAMLFLAAGAYFITEKQVTKTATNPVYATFTPPGQKAVIRLADGSRVMLNAGSRLVYPHKFDCRIRMVKLEGEAFFEVARDPKKPFCILSGDLLTRVLGTSFNIENDPLAGIITVTVATGQVAVDEKGDKNSTPLVELLPGEQLCFNLKSRAADIYRVNVADVTAWKENRLVFNNTPFARIAADVERLYGVHIDFDKKALAKKAFTARFKSNVPLAEVLRVLSATGQFSYMVNGRQVSIQKAVQSDEHI